MKYRRVNPQVWNDEKFLALSNDAKLVWTYLLTCPEANSIGLYNVNLGEVAKKLHFKLETIMTMISDFGELGMAFFDEPISLIWLPKWIFHDPPDGTNQLKGYIATVQDALPHRFAKALALMLEPLAIEKEVRSAYLSDSQFILVRDSVTCQFCNKTIDDWDDLQFSVVKMSEPATVDNQVVACNDCVDKKGGRDAEEFGFPFVGQVQMTAADAIRRVIYDKSIRDQFMNLCHGLPEPLRDLEDEKIGGLLQAVAGKIRIKKEVKGNGKKEDASEAKIFADILDHYNRIRKLAYPKSKGVKSIQDKVKGHIRARLGEEYTVADIKKAIEGNFQSIYHREGNYHDLELIVRDATKLTRFMDRADNPEVTYDGKTIQSDGLGQFGQDSEKTTI